MAIGCTLFSRSNHSSLVVASIGPNRLVSLLETLPSVRVMVLAPVWPAAPWFRRLRLLACETTLLPLTPDFFMAGRTGTSLGPPRWRVMAARIDRRCISPLPASLSIYPSAWP